MLRANSNVKIINETRNSLLEEKSTERDDEPQLIGEAKAAMEDISDLNITECFDRICSWIVYLCDLSQFKLKVGIDNACASTLMGDFR